MAKAALSCEALAKIECSVQRRNVFIDGGFDSIQPLNHAISRLCACQIDALIA